MQHCWEAPSGAPSGDGLHLRGAPAPHPFQRHWSSSLSPWQPGLLSLDWLLDHIVSTATDPMMGTGYHGSIKYVNKELSFSSSLRGPTSLKSNGKSPEEAGIRDGDQRRASTPTVPGSWVLGLVQMEMLLSLVLNLVGAGVDEGVATPASLHSLKIPIFFPFLAAFELFLTLSHNLEAY